MKDTPVLHKNVDIKFNAHGIKLYHLQSFISFDKCISCITKCLDITIKLFLSVRGSRCRDRMVVGFTITYAIGAYHH